jgi:class 3 adenylate cyclase
MLENLRKIGVAEGDSQELQLKKFTLLLITLCCCIAAPIWSYSYYLMGLEVSSIVPIVYDVVVIPFIILFAYTKKEKLLVTVQITAIFLCPAVMQLLAGGLMKGGPIILWSFLAPLIALIFMDILIARISLIALILVIIGTLVYDSEIARFGYYIDRDKKILLDAMNVVGSLVVIFFAMQYFVKTIIKSNKLLEAETQKADDLLHNIVPQHVAEEIKETGKASPTLYHNATIVFTDFMGFSQYSELYTPAELIEELALCFERFDEIVTRHGLEKIKTMGDAYMCVAGIVEDDDNPQQNAKNAVRAALEMAAYITKEKEERRAIGKVYWDVRVGIHTGDIIAGVVGKKKFAFDIWGDAVNIASRLETNSEEGRVNISDSTYRLVKEEFVCTHRGKLPVKNKGELDMYFVEREI